MRKPVKSSFHYIKFTIFFHQIIILSLKKHLTLNVILERIFFESDTRSNILMRRKFKAKKVKTLKKLITQFRISSISDRVNIGEKRFSYLHEATSHESYAREFVKPEIN